MAAIGAERVLRHLERAGFVVMKRSPETGGAALGREFRERSCHSAWNKGSDAILMTRALNRAGPLGLRADRVFHVHTSDASRASVW
jgi:hypothetical protein